MKQDECSIGLKADPKYGYKIIVKGDCDKVLQDINNSLEHWGKKYLGDRIIKVKTKPDFGVIPDPSSLGETI
jgi:hypothetical protein